MNKNFTKLTALILFAGIICSTPVTANHHEHSPYEQGLWSASGSFAYAPSVFNEDLQLTTAVANVTAGPVTVPTGDTDISLANVIKRTKKLKYGNTYQQPMRFGFDYGYFVATKTEIFAGFDYYLMEGKKFKLFDQTLTGTRFEIEGKAKANNRLGLFLGARHFFDVCSWYYPYLGFKVGAVIHSKSGHKNREKIVYRILNGTTINGSSQYSVNGVHGITGLYGGLHAGIDVPLHCVTPSLQNTSFFFAIEAVGSGAVEYDLPVKRINTSTGGLQLTHEVTKAPRTIMSFPVAMGLKFRF